MDGARAGSWDPAVDAASRLARLEALPDERDPARRRMLALGLVADRFAEDGLEPILVGGAALEPFADEAGR